jgi:hypothetical protein
MSTLAIFLYGVVVSSLVLTALGLIAWGIVNERRDRLGSDDGSERFASRPPAQVARSGRRAR